MGKRKRHDREAEFSIATAFMVGLYAIVLSLYAAVIILIVIRNIF